MLKHAAVVLLFAICAVSQSSAPDRKVAGNTITSSRDPAIRIHLPKSVQYVGADRWILYDIADCELHTFVDADAKKNVQRIYWIQFEGYIPSRPELKHTYDSPIHTTIGGLDFFVNTWAHGKDAEVRPGSDVEHVQALIRSKGYRLPDDTMSVRLVHLLDATTRKELMIIYSENLASTGFSAADLQPGGKAHDQWPSLQNQLLERAKRKIRLDVLR